MTYVLEVPCQVCAEGVHYRWAAAPWVPWEKRKSAEKHMRELADYGYRTDGWKVVEAP